MKGYKRLLILIRTGWSRLRDFEAKRSKANLRRLHNSTSSVSSLPTGRRASQGGGLIDRMNSFIYFFLVERVEYVEVKKEIEATSEKPIVLYQAELL